MNAFSVSTDRGTSLALIYVGKLNIIKKKYDEKKTGNKILMAKTRSNNGEKVKESPGFLCILLSY